MVESTSLLTRQGLTALEGSNPSVSAKSEANVAETSKARGALCEGFEGRSGPQASTLGSEAGSREIFCRKFTCDRISVSAKQTLLKLSQEGGVVAHIANLLRHVGYIELLSRFTKRELRTKEPFI